MAYDRQILRVVHECATPCTFDELVQRLRTTSGYALDFGFTEALGRCLFALKAAGWMTQDRAMRYAASSAQRAAASVEPSLYRSVRDTFRHAGAAPLPSPGLTNVTLGATTYTVIATGSATYQVHAGGRRVGSFNLVGDNEIEVNGERVEDAVIEAIANQVVPPKA